MKTRKQILEMIKRRKALRSINLDVENFVAAYGDKQAIEALKWVLQK